MPRSVSKLNEEKLKQLGERVRSIRESKGMTLQAVALVIGKDRQSIHRLEKGDFNPTYIYLLEVCEGLGIEISELFN